MAELPDNTPTGDGVTGDGGRFDPSDPKDLAMLRRVIARNRRYKLDQAMRDEVIDAAMDALRWARQARDTKEVGNLARTVVLIDKMNQADEHLALKLEAAQTVAETPRVVLQWTDPPRPQITGGNP